jgi:hypothetical protein
MDSLRFESTLFAHSLVTESLNICAVDMFTLNPPLSYGIRLATYFWIERSVAGGQSKQYLVM